MYRQRYGRRLAFAVAMIAGAAASLLVTHAFAAVNTMGASKRGEGSAPISGYSLSEVHHNLNATNPRNIDSVTFNLDAPATGSTVRIRLASGSSDWYSCSVSGDPAVHVTCPTTVPQATLAQADALEVVAAD